MATMEKLMLQIFERKKGIIDHVKRQADLFDQHLASILLIDGISPPSWLWNPTFPSQSSYHPEELNKEELISGLFLPHPQLAVPYSSSYCSLYNKPVVTANNEAFPDGLFTNADASNVGFDAGDGPSVLPQSSINNVGCASNVVNGVPDQDPGVMSPEDRKDAKISDTYPDPVQSLARIQRSKSRQRALELRSSARETKIRLCDKENTGVDASRFTGSAIASLQDDHSDRLKLVIPFDANNENCVLEETTVDDFRSKERGNGIYSGRITRSRSSGRQPSCINDSSTVGSPYIAKEDDGTRPVSLGRSKNQPNHRHELMELVNPPDTCNESRGVREAQTGDYDCKEIGSNIYSGRITRTGSGRQSNNVGESSAVVSFHIPKEDCGVLAESLGKSTQPPNHANELLELVNSSDIGNESCGLREAKIGDYWSREKGSSKYCGRITRSRSYCQQQNCVNESSKLDSSSGNGKEDGASKSIQQLNHFDDLVELVKASDTTSEGSGMKAKVGDYQTKEQRSNIYSGRITRSRSSCQQPNFTNESLKMSSSSSILKDDDGPLAQSICKLMQPTQTLSWRGGEHNLPNAQHPLMAAVRSSPGQNDLKLRAANARECSSCHISAAGYVARNTRSLGNQSVEGTSKAVNSSNPRQRVSRSTSAASNVYENAQANRRSMRSSPSQKDLVFCTVKGLEHPDKEIVADEDVGKNTGSESICNTEGILNPNQPSNPLGRRGKRSRSNASNNLSLSSRCEDFDLQKMSGTDGAVGAPVCSGSNLDDAGLRVGFEVLASRQPFDCPMFVKPKQLDFADVEDYRLNEITSPAAGEARSKSLKENDVGEIWGRSSEPTDLPNGVISINYEKECNSSLEMPLLEKQEDLTNEKDAYKGSSEAHVDGIAEASRGSNFNPVSPVEETSEICKDSVPHTLLENDKISKQKKFMIDPSTTLQVVCGYSLQSPLQEEFGSNLSKVNDDARMNPSFEGIEELDVVICTKADSKLDTDAYGGPNILVDADFAKEFLSAVTEDETRCHSVQQKIINAESSSLGICINDDKNVDCSKSSEHQISKKSILPGRSFSPGVESSWPWHKRRKIECQLTKSQSASPSLRVNPPEKEVAQSNIGNCPDVEMLQNVEHYMIEKFTFSPKLQIEEGDVSLRRDRWVDTSYTFTHNQLDASLVSSLTKQATGYPQGQMTEEVEVAVPTSFILDVGRQCTAEEDQVSLHPEDEFELEDKLERKSHIGGNGKFSYFPVFSPGSRSTDLVGPDHSMPVLEGFTMQADNEQPCISGIGISFDKLDLQNTTIDRASVLEQLCKSACVHSPLTHISTTYKLHRTPNLYQSVPNGLLECMDLRSTLPISDDTGKQLKAGNSELNREVNCSLNRRFYSDCLPLHSAQSVWDIRNPYMSPVGKLWDRISSNSDSSEKKVSLNSELPCISEENENTDEVADIFQEGIGTELLTSSAKREPLVDIAENPTPTASVSEAEKYVVRDSLDSIKEEISFTGTRNRVKQKFVNHNSIKRRYNNKENENQSLSLGTNGSKRVSESLHDRYSKPKLTGKTSLRKGGTDLSVKESKHNNIVSNVNSFIPLIQQKQAAAVVTGKRDIKVKALEAAGAAKRLEEERENERKRKKEALKVERARLEQENLRQLEIQKKRKEQERRKKDVEMASKKRQREEEERKGKEQKRKRIEETRRQQQDKEKLHAEKEAERARERKETRVGTGKHEKMEKGRRDDNLGKVPETAPRTTSVSTSDVRKESTLLEDRKDSSVCGDITKVINNSDKATPINLVSNAIKEQSYEISPYQASEDEDDDDNDNIQNSKFVPSWASKKCVALVVSSQQRLDPDTIFPPGSFCAIDEVCLPQKLGQKQLGK